MMNKFQKIGFVVFCVKKKTQFIPIRVCVQQMEIVNMTAKTDGYMLVCPMAPVTVTHYTRQKHRGLR